MMLLLLLHPQIEGFGLYCVVLYELKTINILHNRIDIIEIESNHKECESLHP